MQGSAFHVGDRVAVRDRPWRVAATRDLGGGRTLLTLLPAGGDGASSLAVVSPPETVIPLPPEELRCDPAELAPLAPWLQVHRALALTAVRDETLLGAPYGRVNLEAYQIAPVLRILAKPRPSLLIADDVGLGKTIEAGLCLLELRSRKRADRVLVVVPAGLVPQWEEELLQRFGLSFTVIENAAALARAQTELPAGVSPWDLPKAQIITSVDYLKKAEVMRRALARLWDVIIVDEAHALAESGTPSNPYRTRRTRLGERLREKSRGLLLLTATPHNGYSHSFRSLIELVDPTAAAFSGRGAQGRVERAMVRRMKRQIVREGPDGQWIPAFPTRSVQPLPVPVSEDEAHLFRSISRYCGRTVREARKSEDEELVSFAMQIVKKRATSSRLALSRTLEHRLQALKREQEREEKPDRSELREYQAGLPMSDRQAERIARRILRSAIPRDEQRRKTEVRLISDIQRQLARLPGPDPKVTKLVEYIRSVLTEDPAAKVIVFTEYLDTLEAIKVGLDKEGPPLAGAYVELRGGLSMRQRQRVQQRFEDPDIRVLLATDAASEGLNLQRQCHRLIHFELPWNPNRLEQRNGRIDRYGQTRPPQICYLYYPDSPEDDVLSRLVLKIEKMASSKVSTPDVLGVLSGMNIEGRLAELEPDDNNGQARLVQDFEDRTAEFAANVQLLVAAPDAQQEIQQAKEALSRAIPLLGDDLELEQFLLDVLGPRAMRSTGAAGIYDIEVPRAFRGPGVLERYPRATCRRSIAANLRPDEVEFLTPLHPLLQAIAADARRKLLQVYPDDRGLSPKRLAARRIPSGESAGVLFTFFGAISSGEGLVEEAIVPVRVDLPGTVAGDPETDARWLQDATSPGEVPAEALAAFGERFDALLDAARKEAGHRLAARAAEIRQRRAALAEQLRSDAKAYRDDRLKELEEQELRSRGLLTDTGQLQLELGEDTKRHSIEARRAAVEQHFQDRLAEIEAFERVHEPEPPQPLGALFLVPEDA